MNYTLIRRQGDFPPGGFIYTDPRTGMTFDGNGGFDFTVHAILAHRRANPRLYPKDDLKYLDFDFVANELDTYTCNRIKNSPYYCKRVDSVSMMPTKDVGAVEALKTPCPNCGGTDGKIRYCASCSGRKQIGHYCTTCNYFIPKA